MITVMYSASKGVHPSIYMYPTTPTRRMRISSIRPLMMLLKLRGGVVLSKPVGTIIAEIQDGQNNAGSVYECTENPAPANIITA